MAKPFAWNDGKDHYGNPNPAYDPEACGIVLVAELEDEHSCYSFDTILVWKDVDTGAFYAAHDSGCSCPTPFENIHSLDDMQRISGMAELHAFVGEHDQCVKWTTGPFYDKCRESGLR